MDLLRLQYLLKTQAEKTISEEERMELLQYLSAEENEELIKDIIGQVYQHPGEEIPMNEKTAQDMLQLILQSGEPSAKLITMPRRNIGYRITVAAAVLLVIISAAWLLMEMVPKPETQHQAALSGDVKAPAVNKAMITLANGQRVYLDSVKNGQLALQGNIKLIKLTDGRIVYQTANGEVLKELQYNTLYNPRGSKVIDMALADGSRVWLNAGSSITYPVAFIGIERKVAVTGEAYFEVAHNASKPFVVTRGATIVQVLGTHFNVNAYEDEDDIKVTLLQGAVKVSNSNQSAVIKPGQQARVISHSKPEIRNDVDLEQVMAWKNGQFNFDDADLPTVLRQLARWYDLEVVYQGAVPEREFGGKMQRDLMLSQVLRILQQMDVKFTLEGKRLLISSSQ